MADEPETTDTMIAALLREREGYVNRGLKDRVAQVDEQLKLRGHKGQRGGRQPKPAADGKQEETKSPTADPKAAADERPQGRTQRAPEQT